MKINSIILFIFLFFTVVYTADYYVSTAGNNFNNGLATGNAFRTIQKGIDTISPGDTLNVLSGTYYEKVYISTSGTENDPIVIQNYNSDQVKVSGTGISNNPASYTDDIFYLKNVNYITIQGFEISDIQSNEGSGIRLYGKSNGVKILNNRIHEIRGGASDGGAMGITIYGSNNNDPIQNILIQNNEIYDCDPAHSEALTLNGHIRNFQVINNIIHDVNNIGIDVIGGETWLSNKSPSDGIISRNTVYNARSSYGGGYAGGIYVDGASNVQVTNNEVYQCDMGIEIGSENGDPVENVIVSNNYIHNNDKAGLVFGGYNVNKGRIINCTFRDNFLQENDQQGEYLGEIWIQYAHDNVLTGNIIISNIIISSTQNIMLYSESGNVDNNMNNNCYCTRGDKDYTQWEWVSQTYTGLTHFQSIGQAENSIFLDTCPTYSQDLSCSDFQNVNCSDGQYEDSNTCQDCLNKCATCDNGNDCLTCAINRENDPGCDCIEGYYEDNAGICQECHSKCQACNSFDQCTTCANHVGRSQTTPDCDPEDGYYDDNSNEQPQECLEKCATCSNGTTCNTCSTNRENTPGCDCINGYYEDNAGICQECHSKCQACSSFDQCTTCTNHIGRSQTTPDCEPEDGYYDDNSNEQPQECLEKCATCDNGNDCLTCAINRENDPGCDCMEGYYEDNTGICQECQCSICDQNDQCTKCIYHIGRDQFTRDCQAEDGYYYNDQNTIQPCLEKCITCENGNNCLTCVINRENSPDCTCIEGYYQDNQGICQKCHTKCQACSSFDQCTTCSNHVGRSQNTPNCEPEDGYYDDNDNGDNEEPQECLDKCLTCSNGNSCDTCLSNKVNPPLCNMECLEGQYQDQNTQNCLQCHNLCETCESQNKCLACQTGYYLIGSNINNINCQECDIQCKTCNNLSSECQVCQYGLKRTLQTPTCGCEDGFFAIEGQLDCQQCSPLCKTCNTLLQCISCSNPFSIPPLCSIGFSGFFELDDQDQQIVIQCNKKCLTCQNNPNQCTQCYVQPNRTNILPNCDCQQGYHDNYQQIEECAKCDQLCVTCQTFEQCTTCKKGLNRELNIENLQCECIQGYKEYKNQQICRKCYFYNDSCHFKCPEGTIQNEKSQICVKYKHETQENAILIIVCGILLILLMILIPFSSSKTLLNIKKMKIQFDESSKQLVYDSQNLKKREEEEQQPDKIIL